MKRSTQLAELKTQVKHNTLHKVTARGGKGSKMVANQTKQSLRITWVKTTHRQGIPGLLRGGWCQRGCDWYFVSVLSVLPVQYR